MAIPETQREAWDSIQNKLSHHRRAVYSLISTQNGLTTHTISQYLGWPINCVSGRVTELAAAGLIKDSGRRGTNPSGRRAILWVTFNAEN